MVSKISDAVDEIVKAAKNASIVKSECETTKIAQLSVDEMKKAEKDIMQEVEKAVWEIGNKVLISIDVNMPFQRMAIMCSLSGLNSSFVKSIYRFSSD